MAKTLPPSLSWITAPGVSGPASIVAASADKPSGGATVTLASDSKTDPDGLGPVSTTKPKRLAPTGKDVFDSGKLPRKETDLLLAPDSLRPPTVLMEPLRRSPNEYQFRINNILNNTNLSSLQKIDRLISIANEPGFPSNFIPDYVSSLEILFGDWYKEIQSDDAQPTDQQVFADHPLLAQISPYLWSQIRFDMDPTTDPGSLKYDLIIANPSFAAQDGYAIETILEAIKDDDLGVSNCLQKLIDYLSEGNNAREIPIPVLQFLTQSYYAIDSRRHQYKIITLRELQSLMDTLAKVIIGRDLSQLIAIANAYTTLGPKTSKIYEPLYALFKKCSRLLDQDLSNREILQQLAEFENPPLTALAGGSLAAKVGKHDSGITEDDLEFYMQQITQIESPSQQTYRLGILARNKNLNADQLYKLEKSIRDLRKLGCNDKEFGIAIAKVVGNSNYARVTIDQKIKRRQTMLEILSLDWHSFKDMDHGLELLVRHEDRTGDHINLSTVREAISAKIVNSLQQEGIETPIDEIPDHPRAVSIAQNLVPDFWEHWERRVSIHMGQVTKRIRHEGRRRHFDTLWSEFTSRLV